MKRRLTYLAGLVATVVLLAACSTTQILSSWKGEVPANTTDKVLVFSLIAKSNAGIDYQDNFEDEVVLALKKAGVKAYSAYDTFGPSALKKMDKNELAKKINDGGYTGVLLLTFLDKDQHEEYVPPTTTTYAVPAGPVFYDPWFHPYYQCYNYYYDEVTTPGYWQTTTRYILEARLFNARDEKDAVYIGTTSTQDPDNTQQAATDFANTIIKDMKKKGVL